MIKGDEPATRGSTALRQAGPAPESFQLEPKAGRSFFFSSENRILFGVIVTISLVLLGVAFAIYGKYQETLDDEYNHFGEIIASMVSVGAVDALSAPLSPELKVKAFIDSMVNVSNDVAAIELYDTQGRLVYASRKVWSEADLRIATDFSAPLKRNNEILMGEAHVKLTGKTMKNIASATRTIVLLVFLSAWLISILAVSLNTYILSKHLRTLVRGVKRLSTGDFGYKILENDLWGELKVLAESFNDMSVRLRTYEDQNLDTITFERNKLEAVLLSIADGVIVCDLVGEIIIINDSACQMLGVKTNRLLIGTRIQDYFTVEGVKCFEPMLKEFGETCLLHQHKLPEPFSRQVEMPGLGLKVIVSPIQDAEGDNLGFVMIMHDITKEMEVDKMKTSFISNVSHELRTPVTTIKSYVDTIYNHGSDLDPETYQEFIETINVETDRLKKLVNDILDFSRLDEGGVKLEMELQDMTPVINLTVQSVKVLAQQKNIHLTTTLESNLPKVLMNSDSIERVLRNLLSNAIKYTPENGRIKVRAEVIDDNLEVSVQDNGIGIPEEHLPFIFDRFYRVENKVHTVKGTGLGLHLVKITIENHHQGEVFVKSDVGTGSTFGFRLPLNSPLAAE